MANMPLRIMTDDFQLLDEITQYGSLQLVRSWTGIGSIELRINRYLKGADKLQRGHIIFPQAHLNKAFQIRHKEIELDENGKATENWIIRAPALKSWFSDRLTIPPAGKSHDSIKADAESVMYHYADTQAIHTADPSDSLPVIAGVSQQRGEVVDWQSRYRDLAEEMAAIGQLSGLGWNIGIDYDAQAFRFDVLLGRDLTAGQSVNPPAIFSTEFGTLQSLSYMESDLDFKNVAVVAGQGEGVDRRIVTVGDLTATGLDRRVLFVDARDVAEETEDETPVPRPVADIIRDLENRGVQKLAEHQQEIFLEGQALPVSRLVYGKDYDLGDLVTLQNKEWGVTMDARITEIKEIYEPGKTGIELMFDNSRPTLVSKIKQELAGVRNEIVR
ncbi:hypothetical protein NCCP2716_23610 [Sporosarcina sp. NCCP-2716]|uniref:siphovirus ReqiPepy6 Gp37-like family protein n=1 Tax=Sporosarcina sp. NCCP-2716 TaxID=2943679 RepID=UPI00203CC718|nr:siphovirus ReqiPepy6 Gp37-like family protein [Sporosarcina sp. NCCP-2716]GKV69863.1 hypothetical protein NCCP2716_23610 [Sporosarcina sp. NCCP-2716]